MAVEESRAGMGSISSRSVLNSDGELVVGVDDKFPERDWNTDSWEEVSKRWVESP